MNIIWYLIIGGIAGWGAGQIMKGDSQGLLMNIVIGIVGGVLGNFLFGLLGVSLGEGILGAIITATIGAVVLLFIYSKLKKN